MSGVIRVILVDDEELARERLRRLLSREDDVDVVAMCPDGDSAVEAIAGTPCDLVFLDVQMPGRDGFGVIRELLTRVPRDRMPILVFVTAYDHHALRAFEAQALDYLVKPFGDERFALLLDRVRRLVRQSRAEATTVRLRELLDGVDSESIPGEEQARTADISTDRLLVRVGSKSVILRTEDIDWIGADGVYARIHVGRASYLIRAAMHELESRLDAQSFLRIHRSTIINIGRACEVHDIDRGECVVILDDGTRLRISRSRRLQLESRLGPPL